MEKTELVIKYIVSFGLLIWSCHEMISPNGTNKLIAAGVIGYLIGKYL